MKLIFRAAVFLSVIFAASWPVFAGNFFPVHDDTQPSRIFVMHQALSDGQFPVRIVEGLGYGYGYPIYNFYAPFPYYAGAFFYEITKSAIFSAKLMYFTGIAIAAAGAYLLGKKIAGFPGALLFMSMFTFAPYHGVNIFVRGAVGEYYAYGFIPFLLLGLLDLQENFRKGYLMSSVSLFFILISHNILSLITFFMVAFAGFALLTLWVSGKIKSGYVKYFCLSVITGFLMSSFFSIPAIAEKGFTNVESVTRGGSRYYDHFVFPDQLWSSPIGFAGSSPGREDGMTFVVGKAHLLVLAFGLFFAVSYLLFYRRIPVMEKGKETRNIFFFFLSLMSGLFSIFMLLDVSRPLWEILPFMEYVQFPWRFLNFAVFFISLSSVVSLCFLSKKFRIIFAAVTAVIIVIYNTKYFRPSVYTMQSDKDYISESSLEGNISAISDEYLPPGFARGTESNGIELVESSSVFRKYSVSQSSGNVFPVAAIPGWRVFSEGKEIPFYQTDGKIAIQSPGQPDEVTFVFRDTPVRKAANTISFLGIFLLVYVTLYKQYKPKCPQKKRK